MNKNNQEALGAIPPNSYYSILAEELTDNKFASFSTRNIDYPKVTNDVYDVDWDLLDRGRSEKEKIFWKCFKCFIPGQVLVCKYGTKSRNACSKHTTTINEDFWLCHSATERSCFSSNLNLHNLNGNKHDVPFIGSE